MKNLRKPFVAGAFYPSDPQKLRSEVEEFLSLASSKGNYPEIFGLISPHAGYKYSGKTAAYGYKLIAGKNYETVIIISPSHFKYFPGVSVYPFDGYYTPLGVVEVDKQKVNLLAEEKSFIVLGEEEQVKEHAIEVQLPFLQCVLGSFKIVPIVMGDQKKIYCDKLSKKLEEIVDDKTLIVASSDLSHYYSLYEANRMDSILQKRILEFDYDHLYNELDIRRCEACGGGPIIATMITAEKLNKTKTEILNYSTSADVSGDTNRVVGYLSAVIYGD